jgi:hypothetical protein
MSKPKKTIFTEALEGILLNIWGSQKDILDDSLIKKTRTALIEIRGIYRFKGDFPGKYPSTIQYRLPKNRAGYVAAFGQRHAYLPYIHLKKINEIDQNVVPTPYKNNRLVVTLLGAGAALEIYGLCYYYNEEEQLLQKLSLNLIDKVDAWKPNRHTVFDKLMKATFPKMDIIPTDIDIDLAKNSVPKLADNYDKLRETDILFIYNVMNEIDTIYARIVWKNIEFLLNNLAKPVLILLMEPSVLKAKPRIDWLKRQLLQCTKLVHNNNEEEIFFNSEPTKIDFEEDSLGLNHRLFSSIIDGSKPPQLMKSITRTHFACRLDPKSPIKSDEVAQQLKVLQIKRGEKGHFSKHEIEASFADIYPEWNL